MDYEGVARRLEDSLGSFNVVLTPGAEKYWMDGKQPKLVVFPGDLSQFTETMAILEEEGISVVPRGEGTKLDMGSPLSKVEVVLSMARLDRILEYEPADLTVTVEAGIKLSDLQKTLAEQGQFLPLDPPYSATTTIGGTLATNASGPRRLLYGTARDIVLGTKVVRSDGTVVKAGGKVVKNVAGYDMSKLYLGSLGTLGLIAEISLKLRPIPPRRVTLAVSFETISDAAYVVRQILGAPLVLSAMDLFNPSAVQYLKRALSGYDDFALLVSVEDVEEAVQVQLNRLQEICTQGKAIKTDVLSDDDQEALWRGVDDLPGTAKEDFPDLTICKASTRISQIQEVFLLSERMMREYNTEVGVAAHAGNGVVRIYLLDIDEDREERLRQALSMVSHIRKYISELGGILSVESAPVEIRGDTEVWGIREDTLNLMKQIKAKMDPKGILNPGRFPL